VYAVGRAEKAVGREAGGRCRAARQTAAVINGGGRCSDSAGYAAAHIAADNGAHVVIGRGTFLRPRSLHPNASPGAVAAATKKPLKVTSDIPAGSAELLQTQLLGRLLPHSVSDGGRHARVNGDGAVPDVAVGVNAEHHSTIFGRIRHGGGAGGVGKVDRGKVREV